MTTAEHIRCYAIKHHIAPARAGADTYCHFRIRPISLK